MTEEITEKRTMIRIGYHSGGYRRFLLCDVNTPEKAKDYIPHDATVFYIGFSVQEFVYQENGLEMIGLNPIPIYKCE